MKNENLEAALGYLSHGTSIIPVGKNKIPLIPWKEFQTRLPTKEEVILWFTLYPEAQVGIVTGAISNITVVDIENGGDPGFLPQDTAIIRTGGQGWHYYFLYEEGIGNSARIRDKVDIRGTGGYVVAPPSFTDKGQYTIEKRAEKLLPFPRELFGLEARKRESYSTDISHDSYPGYGEGQRNTAMASWIGSVLTRIHPTDWETLAWPLAQSANLKNDPPLSENELRTIFKSIWSTEKKNNAYRWNKKSNFVEGSVSLPTWEMATDDDVMLMSEVAKEQAKKFEEVISFGYEIFDNAIRGGSTLGDLVVVTAQTAHGKTSFCQSLTKNFLENNQKVLWLSYEVLVSFLWDKFVGMGVQDQSFCFTPMKNTTGDLGWVEKKIREAKDKYGIKVVCIDHLGYLMPKLKEKDINRNYSVYLTQIVRELKQLAISEKVIIILPVHMRKTDDPDINDIRDSSGVAQEADLVFILERQKNEGDNRDLFLYSDYTKITLAKNRKTGKTVIGKFLMKDDYFSYDPIESIKRNVKVDKRSWGKKGNGKRYESEHEDKDNPIFGTINMEKIETPWDNDTKEENKSNQPTLNIYENRGS